VISVLFNSNSYYKIVLTEEWIVKKNYYKVFVLVNGR